MKISQSVSFSIECAHQSPEDPRLHGHSYVIQVWTDECRNLVALQAETELLRQCLDHSFLNDSIGATRMEDLGEYIMKKLNHIPATKVIVTRPTLGFTIEVLKESTDNF